MVQNGGELKRTHSPRKGLSVFVKALLITAVPIVVLSVVGGSLAMATGRSGYSAIAGVGSLVWVAAAVAWHRICHRQETADRTRRIGRPCYRSRQFGSDVFCAELNLERAIIHSFQIEYLTGGQNAYCSCGLLGRRWSRQGQDNDTWHNKRHGGLGRPRTRSRSDRS